MLDYMLDQEFLSQLDKSNEKEIYARIISLTKDERPIEQIEGRVTGGNITVDGNSAVRRTCNLTMVAQDIDINEYCWGIKNKFKMEIGLKNKINPKYPDIVWFKMGTYAITAFNTTQAVNQYTININGKDKMCLINGELSGALPYQTDFGKIDIIEKDGTRRIEKVPIKTIIFNMIKDMAGEMPYNIIIDDIEDFGLELLEYRGKNKYLYLEKEINSGNIDNISFDENTVCYIYENDNGNDTWIETTFKDVAYESLFNIEQIPQEVYLKKDIEEKSYYILRISYGNICGYRETDLVYAGDLIGNVGEPLTAILDKIKNMLGNYEYFYNLNGQFVFRKKPQFASIGIEKGITFSDLYLKNINYEFLNGNLVNTFSNTPNLGNIKNDFSIWGTYKTSYGSELPIHMRYALDNKPIFYKSIEEKEYNSEEYDWRELIYQMAIDSQNYSMKDDFYSQIIERNGDIYPFGRTNYEQYYTDIRGEWRQLYNPNPEVNIEDAIYSDASSGYVYINSLNYDDSEEIFVDSLELYPNNRLLTWRVLENLYVRDTAENEFSLKPFIDYYCKVPKKESVGDFENCYYFENQLDQNPSGKTNDKEILNKKDIRELYVKPNEIEEGYDFPEKVILEYLLNTSENLFIKTAEEKSYELAVASNDGSPFILKFNKDLKDEERPFIYPIKTAEHKGYLLASGIQEIYNNSYVNLVWYIYNKMISDKNNRYEFYLKDSYKKQFLVEFKHGNPQGVTNDPLTNFYFNFNNKDDKGKYYFRKFLSEWTKTNNCGESMDEEVKELIKYYYGFYDFYKWDRDNEPGYPSNRKYWSKKRFSDPSSLTFWFDFLDTKGSDLEKFSVPILGYRQFAKKDQEVKRIFYENIPNRIYRNRGEQQNFENYSYCDLTPDQWNLFTISSKGKSAKEEIETLLQKHTTSLDSINLKAIPVYYLEPNQKIAVKDEKSNINGEYIISKISYPLTYNGLMTIQATKFYNDIY